METNNLFPSTILGWISLLLTFIAYILMNIGIAKNNGRGQKFFSWFIWIWLDILLFLTVQENNGHCLFLVFGCIIWSTITTLLLIKYKKWEWSILETRVLIMTIIFVIIWQISGSGTLGITLAVSAQLIAGWPLMKESWENPGSGITLISYIIFIFVYLLMIIESPNWEIQNSLFPSAFFLYTIADTLPLLKKWFKKIYPMIKEKYDQKIVEYMLVLSILLILTNKKFR